MLVSHKRLITYVSSSVLAVCIALFITGIIVEALGKNPFLAIFSIFNGALGSYFQIISTANLTSVLLLTGLASAVAFTAGVFNIGMEGQLYIGALASVAVTFGLSSIGYLAFPLIFLAGIVAGGAYAAIAGYLKVKFKVNEVVSTLLLNYVALLLIDYITGGPLSQKNAGLNTTPPIPHKFELTTLFGSPLNVTLIISIIAAMGIAFVFSRTKFGFGLRIMGGNPRAGPFVGMKLRQNVILTMFFSGGLAGLAGTFLVLGQSYSLFVGISKSYGYMGIGVALLAQLNPIASIVSAFFFSILSVGGATMQSITGVPYTMAQVIGGLIIIILLIRPMLEKLGKKW